MADRTARHNRVTINLAVRLAEWLDGSGCLSFAQSMRVQLRDEAILYPDLMVTCGKATAGDELVITDPKLIIEVLMPSNQSYDQRSKFSLYRAFPSLREYALVEPSTREVEVFRLTPDGWLLSDQSSADVISLASIACKLPKTAVFKGVE